jgi:hypothetical protein
MPNESGSVAAIYRYPVKGLSAEKIDRVVLTPGECLPYDRRFATALRSTCFDREHPEWLPKTHFIMLMRDKSRGSRGMSTCGWSWRGDSPMHSNSLTPMQISGMPRSLLNFR